MAQLGARLNGIEKVVGSNPTGSTGQYKSPVFKTGFRIKTMVGVVGHLPANWENP